MIIKKRRLMASLLEFKMRNYESENAEQKFDVLVIIFLIRLLWQPYRNADTGYKHTHGGAYH